MASRIRENEEVYIASEMLGSYVNGEFVVIDKLSNNKRLDPNNIDDKIVIYERQVLKWFLERAVRLLGSEKNDFIVLMICMSYLEGIEQYKTGDSSHRQSAQFFVNSVNRLYPGKYNGESIRRLYEQSRCGLFHNGMTSGDVIVDSRFSSSIEFTGNDILISPQKLLMDIKRDFNEYIKSLKVLSNKDLRNKFNGRFTVTP